MPDLTMCADDLCPFNRACKRNPASGTIPNKTNQSWGMWEKTGNSSTPKNCTGWIETELSKTATPGRYT